MKVITVDINDIDLIIEIEAMETCEEEIYIADKHNSFDIWTLKEVYIKFIKTLCEQIKKFNRSNKK